MGGWGGVHDALHYWLFSCNSVALSVLFHSGNIQNFSQQLCVRPGEEKNHIYHKIFSINWWAHLVKNALLRPCSSEENGVSPSVRRGPSPVAAPETPSKAACVAEESAAPTPPRSTSKNKQQLNIRTELEQRQGGKPLLNLVVIGTPSPSSRLQSYTWSGQELTLYHYCIRFLTLCSNLKHECLNVCAQATWMRVRARSWVISCTCWGTWINAPCTSMSRRRRKLARHLSLTPGCWTRPERSETGRFNIHAHARTSNLQYQPEVLICAMLFFLKIIFIFIFFLPPFHFWRFLFDACIVKAMPRLEFVSVIFTFWNAPPVVPSSHFRITVITNFRLPTRQTRGRPICFLCHCLTVYTLFHSFRFFVIIV